MSRKPPAMVFVLVSFIPWILYWTLSGFGDRELGIAAGLVTAIAFNAYRWRKHSLKTLEVVTLAFFAVAFLFTNVLGSSLFVTYGPVLVNGTLALMAWGSLLAGSPFTYEYAREDWDKAFWDDPYFRLINQIISGVWGVVFTVNTTLGALAVFGGVSPAAYLWLTVLIPVAGMVAAIVFSARFPTWFLRTGIRRRLAAADPYPWSAPTFDGPPPAADNAHDGIVVGSGIGGLTTAALLAQRGLKLLVLEQHYLPGGYCTSWERQVRRGDTRLRYVFDAGVHDVSGLHEGGNTRRLLRALGIENDIDWRRMTHEYFIGQRHLRVPENADEFAALLGGEFPAERENIAAFFHEMRRIFNDMEAGAPTTVDGMLAYPKDHPAAYHWMDRPFLAMLDHYFQAAELKEFLSALTGYLSDNAAALTVGHMAPIFGYYFEGGYYPAGGSQNLADALVRVIEGSGGQVRLRTAVQRILVEDGRVRGVVLVNGETHAAPVVVSNADFKRTVDDLVGHDALPADYVARLDALEPSASAFEVFLGLDCVPDIAPMVMLERDGQGVGIMTPSKVDPSIAPPGHASVTLLTLIPAAEAATWDRKAPDYARRKREFGDRLIALAEDAIPNLRQHIVYRQDGTPASCARYAWTTSGAIYGPAAGQARISMKTPIAGLYLVGSAVFPGAGVEAVIISGTLAANAICPAPLARPQWASAAPPPMAADADLVPA
ncbi:MAG: NAD(P)/FAD-dependent oxidoreductase [Anaerolineae bacterium]